MIDSRVVEHRSTRALPGRHEQVKLAQHGVVENVECLDVDLQRKALFDRGTAGGRTCPDPNSSAHREEFEL